MSSEAISLNLDKDTSDTGSDAVLSEPQSSTEPVVSCGSRAGPSGGAGTEQFAAEPWIWSTSEPLPRRPACSAVYRAHRLELDAMVVQFPRHLEQPAG